VINQKLSLSQNNIPEKFREKYLIKRIGEDDIEITLEQRDNILKALNGGARFIQVGKYTLMLNSIKSIDPKWGGANIPPRPVKLYDYSDPKDDVVGRKISNKDEIDLWDSLFGSIAVQALAQREL
jgi:hypothetical protein